MDTIQYTLRGISIEQFATLFEPSGDNIQFHLNIPIRTNYQERSFAIGANVQFFENEKPFLIIEVLCHYIIDESSWIALTDNYTKNAILPKDQIKSLVKIAIDTCRGALSAKTENTPFAKYFLPIIEMQDNQGEDIIIPTVKRTR